ncbi:uncharacterized protein [Ptychodera flava]|uniref:uncharacterized protein n=1 Tax=Ptychodera flava TaxID=63121 RepID=UPI00396A73F3
MGRYITLTKVGGTRAIYLCELEVYGQGPNNVALTKPVTGISLEQGTLHTLPYLIDGIPDTCADSGPAVNRPSFQIDLGQDHLVQAVKLVFPNDCTQTLSKGGCFYGNTVISVSDEQNSDGELCVRIQDNVFQPKGELILDCEAGAVMGRYITLTKVGATRAIYLCELEVYGQGTGINSGCWRDDLRCGPGFPLPNGSPAECDPDSIYPCCSAAGWCGNTAAHCTCDSCRDFRKL